ncbi:MAG: NADPH:quinone reductase [Thermaerobacter sp.]|nr:NADPH:quinone reductase [Thermaerobacter sp.]
MRAIRVHAFGDPEVLQIEEVATPVPGPGEVLVRLRAAGVNPVETYVRSGSYARLPELPYTPGGDGAGDVEAVGEGVRDVRPGDRVYVTEGATYAEYCTCDASKVYPLAERISYAQGAALGVPYATALYALRRIQARAGDWLFVRGGSGAVGVAAVQLARARGLRSVATAGTPQGLAMLREIGADAAVAHDDAEAARALTGGRGFDVILDMAAHHGLGQDLELLAPGGRIAVIGARGPVEVQPRMLMATGASVHGILVFLAPAEELRRVHLELVAGLRDGTLSPVIGKSFPLADAKAAHRAVMQSGAHGKVILAID